VKDNFSIAVVADSAASLPQSSHGYDFLYVVPMNINVDGFEFIDKHENSLDEFYRLMKQGSPTIKTSQPSPNAYLSVFKKIVSKSINKIICVTVSSKLSGSYNSACIAAKEVNDQLNSVNIEVVDSKSAAAGEGLIVLELCKMIQQGFNIDQVLSSVQSIVQNTSMVGAIENLHYAWKSGRIPRLAYWGSNMLGIKPVFELNEGEITLLAKPRTSKKVNEKIINYLLDKSSESDLSISIMHADELERALQLIERIKAEMKYRELFLTNVSPIIGTYAGPGMIGVAFCHGGCKWSL